MEPGESGHETRGPRRLEIWITGFLFGSGLLGALVFFVGEGMIHGARKPAALAAPPVAAPPLPMEPPALAALEKFFEAPDTASKASLVRDPGRTRPMMEDYHERRNHPYPTLGRISPGIVAEFQNIPCVLFQIEPFSGPRYQAAVVWDGKRFAVDWQSMTAYGTMDWSEFTESHPASLQTLRVFVTSVPDNRKIPGLPPEASQFEVQHRDDPQPIIAVAYPAVSAKLAVLTEGQRSPVILEMMWKPLGPGGAPVASVERLVASGWSN